MDGEPPSRPPAAGTAQQAPGGSPAAAKPKRQAGSAVFNEVVIDEVRRWSVAALPGSTCCRKLRWQACICLLMAMLVIAYSHAATNGVGSQVGLASSCLCPTPLISSANTPSGSDPDDLALPPACRRRASSR
jgi:hypothetical protein